MAFLGSLIYEVQLLTCHWDRLHCFADAFYRVEYLMKRDWSFIS